MHNRVIGFNYIECIKEDLGCHSKWWMGIECHGLSKIYGVVGVMEHSQ